ncbi:cucumber peeling cupredoxin-like [Impatiens glandulifera]|uniref:cucumber peeling cupredoxin-like n=1 Tax=Impatiens glandulifera TaxID=253017 RepID=UPI001FB14AE0|nr:cucumber peeling cupredoxin-like [Impatiens glandulifera]
MARLSAIVVFVVAAAIFHSAAAQTSHIVGDGFGWNVPTTTTLYPTWATGKTFTVGDTLVFNFMAGRHDVVQVPKASYDDCSDDNAIGNVITVSPANVRLNTSGEVYFICNVGTHCNGGQKLTITVSPATTAPTTPTTPGSPPTTTGSPPPPPVVTTTPMVPPPSPSSSTAIFASGFLTLLAIFVGYLY